MILNHLGLPLEQRTTMILFKRLKKWNTSCFVATLLLATVIVSLACERDTRLTVEGGNPPTFSMKGNGILTAVRIRGPKKQREAEGEDKYLYWVIKISGKDDPADVESLSPITYGKVPDGFAQVYPERGEAPPIMENEHYYIRVVTSNANGDDGYFIIRNGKTIFAKYESGLPEN